MNWEQIWSKLSAAELWALYRATNYPLVQLGVPELIEEKDKVFHLKGYRLIAQINRAEKAYI